MSSENHAKRYALQATGTLNLRADHVIHPLFKQSAFFDPEDLVQLKYETLRAVEVDRYPIAKAAREFGLSRPTIYEAQTQVQAHGMEGLLPDKRGPKAAHKVTDKVLSFLRAEHDSKAGITAEQLVRRVRKRFSIKLHPRTIQKALKHEAKRGRST